SYFESELERRRSEMPHRIAENGSKSVKGGYVEDLSSREYASHLALSKLDGSFQPDKGDPIEVYNDGRINGGMHRAAADKLLGFDDSAHHNLDTNELIDHAQAAKSAGSVADSASSGSRLGPGGEPAV